MRWAFTHRSASVTRSVAIIFPISSVCPVRPNAVMEALPFCISGLSPTMLAPKSVAVVPAMVPRGPSSFAIWYVSVSRAASIGPEAAMSGAVKRVSPLETLMIRPPSAISGTQMLRKQEDALEMDIGKPFEVRLR